MKEIFQYTIGVLTLSSLKPQIPFPKLVITSVAAA